MCHQSSASSLGNRGYPSGTNLHTGMFHSICPVLNRFRNAKAFFQKFFSLEKKSSYLDLIKIPTSNDVAMRFISRRYRHLIFPCTSRYVPKCLIFKRHCPLAFLSASRYVTLCLIFKRHCPLAFLSASIYVPKWLIFQRHRPPITSQRYVAMCLFFQAPAPFNTVLSLCAYVFNFFKPTALQYCTPRHVTMCLFFRSSDFPFASRYVTLCLIFKRHCHPVLPLSLCA